MSDSTSQKSKPNQSIARSAFVMGVATFISRIAGLLREQTFAYLFGATMMTDAFNVAFRIPNLLRDLFAEGAMTSAFVPTFNAILKNEGKDKAFRLTNLTFCAIFVVVGIITIVGIIFTPAIVKVIAPEFLSDPQKFNLTVSMTRIMFPFLLVISLAAISMGILNSLGDFFVPAVAPAFLNLVMIIAGWTLCPLSVKFDMPAITGMALGAMLGGVVQFIVQIPSLIKHGYKFKLLLNFNDSGIKRIVKLIIPGTIGMAATQINIAISTMLATSQGDGAVSWLSFAFRVMQLPLGLFGVAVAQATLPVISRQAAANEKNHMSATLVDSMRLSIFINLFACFIIMAVAEPIIRILFQHGRFNVQDTISTAMALRAYAVGLVFFCLVKILAPAFYALNSTKIPVLASFSAVIANIILNLLLIKPFGFWGLALGTSIGAVFNALILYVMIQKRLGSFSKYKPLMAITKITTSTAISALSCYYIFYFIETKLALVSIMPGSLLNSLLSLMVSSLLSIVVLFNVSNLLKLEEAKQAKDLLMRKIFAKKY